MPNISTPRTRLLTAAAAATIAVFSLAACDTQQSPKAVGAALATPTATPDPALSAPTSTPPSPSERTRPSFTPVRSSSGTVPALGRNPVVTPGNTVVTGTAGVGDGKGVTCDGANTTTEAAPLSRPVNRLLLTVTNTGTTPCYLYHYPAPRFGAAQSVPPVIEESQPHAVVTLAPGESGFASVHLSAADGSGKHGRTEKTLTVYFQGRTPDQNPSAGAKPELPAKGVYIDSSLKVTYWQQSMEDALLW
ncbi:DUF4232 domain-containing protein [Streptomyces sp. JJ66]|uniref:DUF4232 domain-containing protein n=1 Tax=Streptomyces sp. JJ66 TaxID=2803843 RepID=UPI001C583BDD|nr:DUF4232 domain-containing protein [Streptomyces sp. JJ66]MBW1603406.1 DUF4232 domain-containing protein [Streptomyces sp. JJ66]